MSLLIRREILAADYARAVRLGQRARASELALQMRALVAEILRGEE